MRFVFDTSVLIDYLRIPNDIAADALLIAAERGQVFISVVSLMELYMSQRKSNWEIEAEIRAIQELCNRLRIRIIPVSKVSQYRALQILKTHRSCLGKNALPDSLILGAGGASRAYLVTRDAHWLKISNKALSPEDLIRRF